MKLIGTKDPVKTKSVVMSLAKKHGVSIDDDGYAIYADAPDGYVFKETELHWVHFVYGDERFSKGEVWHMIWMDIKNGTEKCECEDCELRR